MRYASGEVPALGDKIKDKQGHFAKVTELDKTTIWIRWHEGHVGLEYPPDDFVLVSRNAAKL